MCEIQVRFESKRSGRKKYAANYEAIDKPIIVVEKKIWCEVHNRVFDVIVQSMIEIFKNNDFILSFSYITK